MTNAKPKHNSEHDIPIIHQAIVEADVNHLGVVTPGSYSRPTTVNNEPSLTKQADADRACIHNILSQYQRSGHLPVTEARPLEGVIGTDDYMEAMNTVAQVNSFFEMLPSNIRERFGHRPEKLLEFAADEKNAPELVKLGLAKAPAVVETGGQGGAPAPQQTVPSASPESASPPVEGGNA